VQVTKSRWIVLVAAAAVAGCAHDPPTISPTTKAPEPAPVAALVAAPAAAPEPAPHSPTKIAQKIETTPATTPRPDGTGIHLQVIASSRSVSLSEARDLAAKNARDLPSDLAVAIASQVTPGTLADSFANEIYRRCLTS
jgi:hypothetical protein